MGEQQAQADKGGPFAGLIAWVRRVTAWALALRPVRAWFIYLEHHGPMLADSITYRTLFSLFAGVLLGFSFAALWLADNPVALEAIIDAVDAAIPGLIGTIVDVVNSSPALLVDAATSQ